MTARRRIAAVVVLLVAAGAAAWAFDLPGRLRGQRAGDGFVTLYGNVDIRQVELGFRVFGRIAGLERDEGDKVAAGDVLARLDTKPYEEALARAQAEVERQQAVLTRLETGSRPAEIAQARAAVAEREADLANARQTYNRAARLVQSGTTSQAVFDQAEATRAMVEARLAAARKALELTLEGPRAEDIAAARAALAGAKAARASAETALADATILSPAAGVILSRVREAGAIVQPGATVFTLSLENPVWVRAYVAEPLLGRARPGATVEVLTDSRPSKPYRGRIGFVSPTAEFTPKTVETPELRTDLVYRLRIVVEDADGGLRQGMPVTVRLAE